MRSVKKDSRGEVECLIKAGSFEEAHRTFTKEVAPTTIIEYDYDTLRTLLIGFEGKENTISEWHLGGEIYQDFLALLDCQKKSNPVDSLVLERLLAGLPAVVADERRAAFMETVAIETMSGVVAKIVAEMRKNDQKVDLPKVLRLPLTEDKYLSHTVGMSLGYYRSVMAGGR
jgi:nuclear pore complex protein Nup98-Nup96